MAIGNGLCDPEHMLKYGDYLYQIGLIDVNGRTVFHKMEDVAVKYIQEKKWNEAFDVSYKHKWLIMSWILIMVWTHYILCFKLNMVITIGLAGVLHWLQLTLLPNNNGRV